MKIWDAVVVGAGPAGCAAAFDLVQAGREVLLLDHADFPRQKACAGGLTPSAINALRYSVNSVIERTFSDVRLERNRERSATIKGASTACSMTVRQDFDTFCFLQTVGAGVQFQRIQSLSSISEGKTYVDLTVDGKIIRACFLIGADGANSKVRQLTFPRSTWFWRGFALEANVPWNGREYQEFIFDLSPISDGYGWIFPKGDHLNIGLYSYAKSEKISRDRLGAYIKARNLGKRPEQMVGQYTGFGAASHVLGNTRIFLVGDAGGFVNPFTGEGISQALRSGQAAAASICLDLAGGGLAHIHFARKTRGLRSELAASTLVSRWFYANLDCAFLCISNPFVHPLAMRLASLQHWLSGRRARVREKSFLPGSD
jgi:geranylgeranyl reductase family protein